MSNKPTPSASADKKSKDAKPAAALPLFLWGGGCNAWECDHLGHMNVRYYIDRAQQGWAPFAVAIKLPTAFHREAVSTLLPREIHMRCHLEVRAGEHMVMHGGVVEVRNDSVVLYQELRTGDANGPIAATYRVILEHVEAKLGRPFAWPQKARDALQNFMITAIPDKGAARSFSLDAPVASASLARANELGVPVTGLSYLQTYETDALGRMRPEFILGRQSDSFGGMTAPFQAEASEVLKNAGFEPRVSGALLEGRFIFRSWPKAGDILEVHSGLIAAGPKTFRFVVWILDPVTGECWTEGESLLANFDVKTRRAFESPAEYQAILEKAVIKGLSL
jgi:acyl-CoA thioester hydrolase